MPATRGAVLEAPDNLFKSFFDPLVIATDKDRNIIGS
jgi:hypothetical protein